jgi:AraC-like DNA-binding protein
MLHEPPRAVTLRPVSTTIPRVRPWQVYVDPKTGRDTHTLPRGLGHALLAPLVAYTFRVLRISATVTDGRAWWAIHSEPSVLPFELEHGVETERFVYNQRNIDAAREQRKTIRGEHAGFHDLFVPIFLGGQVAAFLVVGPFGTSWPTSAEILERWRWISGNEGRLEDPEFAAYLAATLATLVLEGDKPELFERVLGYFARLLSGEGLADELINQAWVLQLELKTVRAVEWSWEAVRTMIDDRFPRSWHSASRLADLRDLGLSHAPDHVLVGLPAAPSRSDALDEAVRKAALQRSAGELARSVGDVIAGRVGEAGVVFLSAGGTSMDKKRKKLLDLAERMARIARVRHAFELHFGSGVASGSIALYRTYKEALAAAEHALGRGIAMSGAVKKSTPSSPRAGDMRSALDFIRRHYVEPLRVEQVAALAGLTQNEFSRLFRKEQRTTFEQHVVDLRLERAKQLLTSTELNATRVAKLCGFHSSQYFSRVFRNKVGVTPLDFRRTPPRAAGRAKK